MTRHDEACTELAHHGQMLTRWDPILYSQSMSTCMKHYRVLFAEEMHRTHIDLHHAISLTEHLQQDPVRVQCLPSSRQARSSPSPSCQARRQKVTSKIRCMCKEGKINFSAFFFLSFHFLFIVIRLILVCVIRQLYWCLWGPSFENHTWDSSVMNGMLSSWGLVRGDIMSHSISALDSLVLKIW